MGKNQYIVAFEIGSSKIVGAIAEKTAAGVQVRCLEIEKLSNCVRYGGIQNPDMVKSSINRIITRLENAIDGVIKKVYVGVSGRSVHSVEVESEHGIDSSRPITEDMIKSYIREMTRNPQKGYEIIDIVPRVIKVDNKETTNPVGQFGSKISISVNLIVAKDMVKQNLDRSIGMLNKEYVITPLAVAKEVLTESERSLGCMLVDMGAETTTVSIYKNNALCYLNTLPLGGLNLTKDIAMGLSVVEDEAESIKLNLNSPLDPNADNIEVGGVKSTDAASFISARMGEIIANINEQVAYAKLSTLDVKSIVIVGGGAQLKGLPEKMEEDLKVKVRRGDYPIDVEITDHHVNRPEYIEIFSLLSRSAKRMEAGESCVERMEYVDGPVFGGEPAPEPTPAPSPAPKAEENNAGAKKKKSGFFDKLLKRASVLLDENDADGEK